LKKSNLKGIFMTFEQRIWNAIEEMNGFQYKPQYLINMINKYGVINAVKKLVVNPSVSQGLERLKRENALHLSLESIALEPEWKNIFTENERNIAKIKLEYLNNIV